MREYGTSERLSVFPERPTDFGDFPEQIWYSCYGRHVCNGQHTHQQLLHLDEHTDKHISMAQHTNKHTH